MYPKGCAHSATRPVGNCAGRRSERVMHIIAKASLQADSRAKMFRKYMKTDAKGSQNAFQFGPWCVLGSFRSSKVTQERPKAPQKGARGGQRAPSGIPKGTPRATKGSQRAPRGSPRATLRDLGRGRIKQKSITEAKKVDFGKSAPRLGPADARSTSDPLKSVQNRPRMLQSRSLRRLSAHFGPFWSLKSASGDLADRFGWAPNP